MYPKCPAEGEIGLYQCQPQISLPETMPAVTGAGKGLRGTGGLPGASFLTCRLALGVQGVDVHGEMEFVANDLLILASEFVSTIDALGMPICPVQAVFKHGDGKGMREAWGKSRRTSVQTKPATGSGPRPGNCTDLTLCQGSWGLGLRTKDER